MITFRTEKQRLILFLSFSTVVLIVSRLLLLLFCHIQDPNTDFISKMCSIWDNNWYYSIISNGYPNEPTGHAEGNAAAWAFFPLDALLIRTISLNGTFDYRTSGFILNNIFFWLGMMLSYKYIMLTRKDFKLTMIYTVVMALGPYCFYFSCLYTESLFMLLNIAFLIEMHKEHFVRMGIIGIFLSACRVTGVFAVFSVLIFVVYKHIYRKNNLAQFCADVLSNKTLLIGTALIPAGLFIYMNYLYVLTGDSLAFVHIQLAWGRNSVSLGELILSIVRNLLSTDFMSVYLVFVFFIVLITLCFNIKRHPYETVLYAVPVIVQYISSGNFVNVARYSIGTGVFVIAFIEMINKHLSRSAQNFTYCLLFILSMMLSMSWFMGRPIAIG